MSVSSIPLSSRASKRRIDEIDETISALSESVKNLRDMGLHSRLLGAKLKKEKLVALQAVAQSQVMLAEMEVLIAENELHVELADLKNSKNLKRPKHDCSRKTETLKSSKRQSRSKKISPAANATAIPVKENVYKQNMSTIPVETKTISSGTLKNTEKHSQEHASNKSVKLNDSQCLGSIRNEPFNSPVDTVAEENEIKRLTPVRNEPLKCSNIFASVGKEYLSSSIEKVTSEYNLKPLPPIRKCITFSPPNSHTNLNNISHLLSKPRSRHAQKNILKNCSQNINNPVMYKSDKIPINKKNKLDETCSEYSTNKQDMTKHISNKQPRDSQANTSIHTTKLIQVKANGNKKDIKRNVTTKKDANIHQDIIDDLFKEIMQSKSEGKSRFLISDKTVLLCVKCGYVTKDHMCEYTIREILESC